MQKNTVLLVVIGVLAGFIIGFWFANSINRSAPPVVSQSDQPANSLQNSSQGDDRENLTPEEISSKVAEADKNPSNFAFQKDLGVALYRYGVMKREPKVLEEAIRILERADSLNAKDFDVLVTLGNGYFDIGFFTDDLKSFDKARTTYERALKLKPNDADVLADIGISYFVQKPPDLPRSVAELSKVIAVDPQHTRSLQFMVKALAQQGKLSEAEDTLAKIKSIDPTNQAIQELTADIDRAKGGTK